MHLILCVNSFEVQEINFILLYNTAAAAAKGVFVFVFVFLQEKIISLKKSAENNNKATIKTCALFS